MAEHAETSPPDEIVRKPACDRMTGVTDRTRQRWEREGTFPQRVRIGPNAVGWWLSEIRAWQQSRPRAAAPTATTTVEPPTSA